MALRPFASLAAVLALVLPIRALADFSENFTLAAGSLASFDLAGTPNAGPDIRFTGTNITLVGSATIFNEGLIGATGYDNLAQANLTAISGQPFNQVPLSGDSLAAGDVFVIHTNAGNYVKVLITAVNSSPITIQFTTYTATAGGGGASAPVITTVQNAYSYFLPGQPSYGIAPGSLFIVKGTNLADATPGPITLQSSAAPGIPTTLNGASVAVNVGGTVLHPGFYYATPTQLAVVLPSSTPAGFGTITVTYNQATSATAPITVLSSALGLDTLYGYEIGLAVATNGATGAVYNYNNSAAPGDTIVLWGSGLGADTADSDTVYTATPHNINIPLTIYIGGILADVPYHGSSGYPGVNQINVTIPPGVSRGCAVAVVAVAGSAVSNTVTIPVASKAGAACSDPVIGTDGNALIAAGSKATYNSGTITLAQMESGGTVTTTATGAFTANPGAWLASGYGIVSLGSCIVYPAFSPNFPPLPSGIFAMTPLDAGTYSITGPSGTQPMPANGTGFYLARLPDGFLPSAGGAFTFNGTGGTTAGAGVGAAQTTVNLTSPMSWTNMGATTSVNRSLGLPITWTGGAPNSYVIITGASSSISGPSGVGISFKCYVPVEAGQFTVPSYILAALPAANGSVTVENETTPQSFTAPNLDYGIAYGLMGFTNNNLPFN
jgi:uncharacterized protein (TIGR03437 family)